MQLLLELQRLRIFFFFYSIVSLLLFGCVSKKQFESQLAETKRKEHENARIKRLLTVSQSQYEEMEDSIRLMSLRVIQQDSLIDSLEVQQQKKQQQISWLDKKVEEKEEELKNQEANLKSKEKKLKSLRYKYYKRQRQSNELKKAIRNAFSSLNKKSFSVKEKSGRLYISLSNKLLFETASTAISPEGKKAIQKLAKVLKSKTKELDIWVEGHTDNVPVTGKELSFKDNWQLSALRASVVVGILVNNGVSSKHISAIGKGAHSPIASNITTSGKTQNRRIEIILLPKLDELFDLIGK